MSDLLVMKFGGTSVGSAERIRVAAGLAAAELARRPVVVVVSAMSKITDLLLGTMRHAEAGDRAGMDTNLATLRARHEDACRELLPEPRCSAVLERIHELIAEFERIVGGMAMLNERPPRSVDEAVAVQAAEVRARDKIAPADALIVATGLVLHCEVIISNDDAWQRRLSTRYAQIQFLYLDSFC